MKKRLLSTLLVCCIILTLMPVSAFAEGEAENHVAQVSSDASTVWDGSIADSYAGGSGTSSNPYLIATAEQLARVADQVNSGTESGKYYRLLNDIYLNDVSTLDSWSIAAPQNKWTPIGNSSTEFSGTFDGKNHVIFGLYISTDADYQGLFGVAGAKGVLNNLGVEKSYVKGGNNVGGIVGCRGAGSGFSRNDDWANCHNGATVVGINNVGGILGGTKDSSYGDRMYSSYNTGNICGEQYVGGLVGGVGGGDFITCYNTGTIKGTEYVGGLAGTAIKFSSCWNVGEISGTSKVGGIAGEAAHYGATSASTKETFNAGTVTGESFVGGIIGYSTVYSAGYRSTITDCYNIGTLTGTGDYVGGIAGQGYSCIYKNCYNAGNCSLGNGEHTGAIYNYGARNETENVYFLTGCCGENFRNGWSTVKEKTSEEMLASEFVSTLNNGGSAWVQDTEGYNSGYPILSGIDYKVYVQYTIKLDIPEYQTARVGDCITVSGIINTNSTFPTLTENDISWSIADNSVLSIVNTDYDFENGRVIVELEAKSIGTTTLNCAIRDNFETESCEIRVELDRWSIVNSSTDFSGKWPAKGGYYISSTDYSRLLSNLSNQDRRNVSFKTILQSNYNVDGLGPGALAAPTFRKWEGSCYGMSVWTCLVAAKELSSKDINYDTLYSVKNLSPEIQSAINYYHFQQCLSNVVEQESKFKSLPQTQQINLLKTYSKEANEGGCPVIIKFQWYKDFESNGNGKPSSASCHVVVGYGLETGNWSITVNGTRKLYTNRIRTYDCSRGAGANYTDHDLYFTDSGTWCIPAWNIISEDNSIDSPINNGHFILVTNDVEIMNSVDYLSGETNWIHSTNLTTLSAPSNVVYTIKHRDSSYLVSGLSAQETNGSESLDVILNCNITADSETVPDTAIVVLPDAGSNYTVESEEDSLEYSLSYENFLAMISVSSSGSATFSPNGSVSFDADKMADYYLSLTSNEGDYAFPWHTIEVTGSDTTDISAQLTNEGVILAGDNFTDVTIYGKNHDDKTVELTFSTEVDSVLVTDNETKDELVIWIDTDDDGTYETPLTDLGNTTAHSIMFDPNGGTLTDESTMVVNEDSKLSSLPTPIRDGYTFDGWYTAVENGTRITLDTVFTENTTVYAHWTQSVEPLEPSTYAVTFTGGTDATGTAPTQADMAEGGTFTLPANSFTKTGYTFAGWSDGTKTYQTGDTYTMPARNVVFTAQWTEDETPPEPSTYTVTFVGGTDATGTPPTQADMIEGGTFALPANSFTRTGYTFAGWNDGTKTYRAEETYTMPARNITFTAQWTEGETPPEPSTYAVTFVGGTDATGTAPTQADMTESSTFTLPANSFKKAGYTFAGWNDGTKTYQVGETYTMPARNITFTAQWTQNGTPPEPNTYVIAFDGVTTMTTNRDGKLSSLPVPTRNGYTFNGWYTANGTRITTNTVFTEDTIVYASWSKTDSPTTPDYSDDSSSDSDPSYSIHTPIRVTGGTVKVIPTNAYENDRVTLTVKPNSGYTLEILTVTDSQGKELELTNQGKDRYTFRMPDSEVSVNAVFQLAEIPWSNPFQDVTSNAWYYNAVKFVSENNLMNGYSNGIFAPDENLSRAMLAQILYSKAGRPSVMNSRTFTDIPDEAWYANAVTWAAENGIVSGYENGIFGPDDAITREQLAVMIWRFAGSPVPLNQELHYADVAEISSYALDALRWASENGIINGVGNNMLAPKDTATRAQVAQILKSYLEK